MKLSFLDRGQSRRSDDGCAFEPDGSTLRVVQQADYVRNWEPVLIRGGEWSPADQPTLTDGIDVRAEITAKRFLGNRVSQERYQATLKAIDGSPGALISALSAACMRIDDFRAAGGADERVILQISLIR